MNRWIDDICTALQNLGGIAHRSELLTEIRRIRPLPHPESMEMIVQRTIQNHSSDSAGFRGEDLLYTVNGIGSGIWGLRAKLGKTPQASDINGDDSPSRILTETYRILRDTELARKIKLLHRNQCQLCGYELPLGQSTTYSEAHHIKPLGKPHNGPDSAQNIIVVCPNHHVQLDFGALELVPHKIKSIGGHHIGKEFIDYHNEVIFGNSLAAK